MRGFVDRGHNLAGGPEQFSSISACTNASFEPGGLFFAQPGKASQNCFRMGYSAIPGAAIEADVHEMNEARRTLGAG